jgi:hypothetical protein
VPKPSKPRPRSNAGKDAPAATEPETTSEPAASPAPDKPAICGPIVADNLDEAFVKALEADFKLHGRTAIAAMRADKPTDYVKIVAALHGKDFDDTTDPLREMSDDELRGFTEGIAPRAGYEIRRVVAGPGAGGGGAASDPGADAD